VCRGFGRPDLVEPLRIMTPGVFFWVLTAVLVHAIRAMRIMRYEIAVKSVAEPLAVFAAALLLRSLVPGVAGLAWAFLFSTAAGTAVAATLFSRLYDPRRILRLLAAAEGRAEFVRFSSYIGIYDLLNLFLQRVDLLLLNAFGTPVMAGVYGMAQNAAVSFKKVRQSFDPMVIPVIVAAEQRAEPGELLRHFRTVTRWVLAVNLAMLGVATFGSGLIMGIFGREFAGGAVPLALLTLAVLMNSVLGVSELFILIDRPALNLVNTAAAILVVVGAGLVLVPRYGMVGAAASLLAGYLVMNVMRLAMVRVLYTMHPFTRYNLRALVAAAGAGLVAAAAKSPLGGWAPGAASAVALAVFLGVYGGLLVVLGLAEDDRALLRRAGERLLRRRGGDAR
jgi:O-antigen/teichoic acid export membrane protein